MNVERIVVSPVDVLLDKWRRRKWLLLACFVLLFATLMSFVLALPPLYSSSTTLQFGQNGIAEALVREQAPNDLELRLGMVTQAVLSRSRLQDLVESFGLYPGLRKTLSAEAVINRLRKDINIEQRAAVQPQWGENATYSVTIHYRNRDAQLAADVANEFAARFRAEFENVRNGQAARTTEFIRTELEAARLRFSVEEARINEFKLAHMGELPEQQAINLMTLERLNTELRLKGEKQVQLSARLNDLIYGNAAGGTSMEAAGLTGRLRVDRLERDLAELRQRYTGSHPEVIRLQQEISVLEQTLAEETLGAVVTASVQPAMNPADIDKELATLQREQNAIQARIEDLVARIDDTPFVDQQLKRLAYDFDTARESYLSLLNKYQGARLAESLELQQNQQFKVLEQAIPAEYPLAPDKRRLLVMGLMLSLGAAVALGLVVEYFDKSFHGAAALRRHTVVPVLAVIDRLPTSADHWRSAGKGLMLSLVFLGVTTFCVLYATVRGDTAENFVWMLAE